MRFRRGATRNDKIEVTFRSRFFKRERKNEMSKADIGLIGLAVMGQNLVLNMNDHGFTVAVFNARLQGGRVPR